MIKFYSINDAIDKNGNPLPDDQRVTPFGQKLRSTSLDEMPQLINVLKGDMSIVGPGPMLNIFTWTSLSFRCVPRHDWFGASVWP